MVTFSLVLSLSAVHLVALAGQPTVLPTFLPDTKDLYAKDRCEGYRAVDEAEFKRQCETDSTFRFYFCGVTCDELYGTADEVADSKEKALTKSCMNVFSEDFCARFKSYGKCQGETQYTGFRLCLRICGYCP